MNNTVIHSGEPESIAALIEQLDIEIAELAAKLRQARAARSWLMENASRATSETTR